MGFDLYSTRDEKNVPKITIDPETNKEKWYAQAKKKREYEIENGLYFQNNVWHWRPLWSFVCQQVGCLTDKDLNAGHFNDGYEISKNKAEQIAITLKELIKDGTIDLYKISYDEFNKDEEHDYPFSVENVINFANFCDKSKGFIIC